MRTLFLPLGIATMAVLAGCDTGLEVTTTQAVDIWLLPARAEVDGQRHVGTLPAGVTVPVESAEMLKSGTAYEVEYVDPVSKEETKGYVLLGAPGLKVREKS